MTLPPLPAPADQFLPHQPPMVYIDTLIAAEGDEGVCGTTLAPGHMLLDGAGRMERAGFVELGAQTFAAHKGYEFTRRGLPFPIGYLVGIQGFECREDAREGDRLTIATTCLGTFEGFGVVQAVISRNSTVLARGKIKLYVPPTENMDDAPERP
ncbi:ApeP family dehydratase [Desulfoplanes sp.]